MTCRHYARRSSDTARDLPSERANRDVYATTQCVVKDTATVPPPYELHFRSSPSLGWAAQGHHGHQQGRRRPTDAEHDYESMDEELAGTDARYLGSGMTDAASCGYQTVGVETAALRPGPGGNGYSATVVSAPTLLHVTRQCSYPLTTFN